MIYRNITQNLLETLADTPVVFLNGARQTGKSTLVQAIVARREPSRYVTLDDATVLAAAQHDPTGFLAGLGTPVILDEVQRAPDLFQAIKAAVDRNRRPGAYLLTGSANVMLLPQLSESLVGRMEVLTLYPFSQGELEGHVEHFVDVLFGETLESIPESRIDLEELRQRLLLGGYPEVRQRSSEARRNAWFGAYVTTLLQRDVRDLANIQGLTEFPRLVSLLAARSSTLTNYSELSSASGIAASTLKRYLTLLEATFLVHFTPPWHSNLGKRLVKSPKVCLVDPGLCGSLLGVDVQRLQADPELFGRLLESFVTMELLKQRSWARTSVDLYHFRTQSRQEVDLVLKDRSGRIVGVEVKSSATLKRRDLSGLRALEEAAGDLFHRGVILYTGREMIPFGPRLHAVPIGALWRTR